MVGHSDGSQASLRQPFWGGPTIVVGCRPASREGDPMSSEFQASNPYLSPTFAAPAPAPRERAPGSLVAPALALIAVAGLGLAFSGFNFVFSFGEANVDPAAPEMVQEFQRGAVGPVAT